VELAPCRRATVGRVCRTDDADQRSRHRRGAADTLQRAKRIGAGCPTTDSRTRNLKSAADRNEIVDPDALNDQKLARSIRFAMHTMGGLWWDGAALAGCQQILIPRRASLDHHWTFETDKGVGDLAVVVPGDGPAASVST
jgi:hypothetical protein